MAASNLRLPIPLFRFTTEAGTLSMTLGRHAKAVSAATNGRIGPKTVRQLTALVEAISNDDRRTAAARDARTENAAKTLAAEILAAVRYASTLDAKFAASARVMIRECRLRRVGPDTLAANLTAYASFINEHRPLKELLPADINAQITRMATQLRQQQGALLAARELRKVETRARNARVKMLADLVREVRAAAAYVFRDEPRIARTFTSAYRRRKQRARRQTAAAKAVTAQP